VLHRADTTSQRLLPPEVCRVAREALLDIVENGSAVRGRNAFPAPAPAPGGGFLQLGGKTGTGDQRFETFGKGGQVLESRVVNRTATFVFFLGDRFFGTLTAHVHGEEAAKYGFTSSLPVALLRLMQPSLMPLISNQPEQGMPRGTVVADRESAPRALPVPAGFEAPLGFPGQAVPAPAKASASGRGAATAPRRAEPAIPLPVPKKGTAGAGEGKVVPAGPTPRILAPGEDDGATDSREP
jgi:hypothetical protein